MCMLQKMHSLEPEISFYTSRDFHYMQEMLYIAGNIMTTENLYLLRLVY